MSKLRTADCVMCGKKDLLVLNDRLLSHVDTSQNPMLPCLGSGAIVESVVHGEAKGGGTS